MLLVLFLVTYFIITDSSRVERVGVDQRTTFVESEISDVSGEYIHPAVVVELLNTTDESNHNQGESYGEVEIEASHDYTTEVNNHKSIYTVEPQKLVFLPSRHLRPPKMDVPVRAKRRRDRPPKRRNQLPKPFNHYLPEPHPAPFKRLPTRRIYSDPGLIGFNPFIPGMQEGFRPVLGSYRRPKGTVPSYYQSLSSNHHPSYLSPHEVEPSLYGQGYPSTTVSYVPDPFHKFKPAVPADVNLLVVDQPSREQHLKMYNEQYLKNAHTLYQQVVKASRQKMGELSEGGNAAQKHRPFKLMLDVYPMSQNDDQAQMRRPTQKYSRFSPHAAKYNALNSINHDKNYDSSYFNRMRFAQIQSKNPYTPYYDHPYNWKINNEGKYVNDQLEAASETQVTTVAGDHPSQLVVHLNLFPKKKKKGAKKPRRPLDQTHDYDDEDEDTSEYLRRSSVESDEIYIDDGEELTMTDKKYSGRPLRSTKVKKNKTKIITKSDKNSSNDSEEDSNPIAINFNFSSDATKAEKNCSHTIKKQKFTPMMDGNDNDVPILLPQPTKHVPKAHHIDFPYRFVSMPPAHIKQRPIRPTRFQNRILKLETFDNLESTEETSTITDTTPPDVNTIETITKEIFTMEPRDIEVL